MKKILSSFSYIMVGLSFLLVMIAMLCSVSISDGKVPSIFGYSSLMVSSGSMEPEFPVRSIVIIKQTDFSNIKVGDVISFYSNDPSIPAYPISHRVKEIKTDDNGKTCIITKGDANLTSDKYPVYEDDILGVVVGKNSFLGKMVLYLSNRWVFLCLIILPLLLVAVLSAKEILKAIVHPEEVELIEDEESK